jgi:hypothetical protein
MVGVVGCAVIQVLEFVAFKERLQRSGVRAEAACELQLLRLRSA